MSYLEFLVSPPLIFAGSQKTFQEAKYVILGVPFDNTSTYRVGARFAPMAIRESSLNLETYSFRTGVDIEALGLHDLGDLHVTADVNKTLKQLELVIKNLLEEKKLPICIGGEHTLTLGAVRAIGNDVAVVSFDAHLDLRNEYMGLTTSHATVMRRITDKIGPKKILEIGVRAVCREELDYARKFNVKFLTVQQIRKDGLARTIEKVDEFLTDFKKIYLTIDLDVIDPAFTPAVQNPEPDGLSMPKFLDILSEVCDHRIVAFDLVEVTPHYDNGTTAIQATKAIFEVLCHLEKSKKAK